MKIEAEVAKWVYPQSTNTEPTYYKSTYVVTGSLEEVNNFQKYIDNYKPKVIQKDNKK